MGVRVVFGSKRLDWSKQTGAMLGNFTFAKVVRNLKLLLLNYYYYYDYDYYYDYYYDDGAIEGAIKSDY